jgi:hypothetical protein
MNRGVPLQKKFWIFSKYIAMITKAFYTDRWSKLGFRFLAPQCFSQINSYTIVEHIFDILIGDIMITKTF